MGGHDSRTVCPGSSTTYHLKVVLDDGSEVVQSLTIQVIGTSAPVINFRADETDVDKLSVGNKVEVVFDALPDLAAEGQVVRVNPTLVIVDGVPALSALAELEPVPSNPTGLAEANSQTARLMPGMNAAVEIIAGRADDALLVPVEALRELGPSQYAVFVMVDDQPTLRPVDVGLKDFIHAQILDGLEQGDVVTTGVVATE